MRNFLFGVIVGLLLAGVARLCTGLSALKQLIEGTLGKAFPPHASTPFGDAKGGYLGGSAGFVLGVNA